MSSNYFHQVSFPFPLEPIQNQLDFFIIINYQDSGFSEQSFKRAQSFLKILGISAFPMQKRRSILYFHII